MNVSERIIVLFYFLVLEMLCGMFMTYRLWENGSIWWTALWWILCSRWTLGAGIALAPVSCLFCEHRRLDKFIFITSSACKVQVCSQTITYTHYKSFITCKCTHIALYMFSSPFFYSLNVCKCEICQTWREENENIIILYINSESRVSVKCCEYTCSGSSTVQTQLDL